LLGGEISVVSDADRIQACEIRPSLSNGVATTIKKASARFLFNHQLQAVSHIEHLLLALMVAVRSQLTNIIVIEIE
ncbi:MAG: hypothetical protein WBO93_16695, partial [Gammaproteobacteria bacterium]